MSSGEQAYRAHARLARHDLRPDGRPASLLGGEPLALSGYPLPMVYAEKLVTALQRGTVNTRWRDFADVWTLSGAHPPTAVNSKLPCVSSLTIASG